MFPYTLYVYTKITKIFDNRLILKTLYNNLVGFLGSSRFLFMKKEGYISLTFSIAALGFSAYAAFVCDKRIETDWMGVLVGILSLLVTVLIGWNIYNLIDFKNKEKEIDRSIQKLNSTLQKINKHNITSKSDISTYIASMYYYLIADKMKIYFAQEYIQHSLAAAYYSSVAGEMKRCNDIIDSILAIKRIVTETIVPEGGKTEMYKFLGLLQNTEQIPQFAELTDFISGIQEYKEPNQ